MPASCAASPGRPARRPSCRPPPSTWPSWGASSVSRAPTSALPRRATWRAPPSSSTGERRLADRDLGFGEELSQREGVRRRLCDEAAVAGRAAVVVVEESERLLGLAGELLQRLHPLAQLLVRVQVVEPLGGAAASDVPRVGVAPVEADVGHRARNGQPGWGAG